MTAGESFGTTPSADVNAIARTTSAAVLAEGAFIPIPGPQPTAFDHGAFDAETGRLFIAHTRAGTVEVIDATRRRHERTLDGHPHAAGLVVAEGLVAVTNRGASSVSILDARTLACRATFPTGARPNGVALVPRLGAVVVACIGEEGGVATLERIRLADGERACLPLPGRPRWCVAADAGGLLYQAIEAPSCVMVIDLATFQERVRWPLPSAGAHGIDLGPAGHLFVACDEGKLIGLAADTGSVLDWWPLPGPPDATFVNPITGRVHVAIGDPGCVVSAEPGSGRWAQYVTEPGAKTTAIAPPDRLFVFLPRRGGALELRERS